MPPVPERASGSPSTSVGRGAGIGGVLVGDEPPGVVAARAGEVGVDVHAAGHDDHAARVERRRAGRAGARRCVRPRCRCRAPRRRRRWPGRGPRRRRSEAAPARSSAPPAPRARTAASSAASVSAADRGAGERRAQRQRHVVHPVRRSRPRGCRRRRCRSRPGAETAPRSRAGRSRSRGDRGRDASELVANAPPPAPTTRIAPAPACAQLGEPASCRACTAGSPRR